MLNLGEILPHVSTRLARRNLAFDLARGAASIHDADRDRYLPQMRTALALGLRILRAQRNHYRQSRPAWACWCGMDTPLRKTDQCADHAPSGAYTSDRW